MHHAMHHAGPAMNDHAPSAEVPAATLRERALFQLKYASVLAWGSVCTLSFLPPALARWGNTDVAWAYAHALSYVGLKILGGRVEISGAAHLAARPAIIVANHQSNYDVLFAGAIYPRKTVVIGKKELLKTPLFGTFFAATGNVLIDRGDHRNAVAGLDKAVEAVRRRGMSIWLFPEGHRSRGTGLGPFKKGAFHMAIAAGVPVIPVVFSSTDRLINARAKRAPGGLLRIHVLPPVPTADLEPSDAEALKDRVHAIFREEWERMEPGSRAADSTRDA